MPRATPKTNCPCCVLVEAQELNHAASGSVTLAWISTDSYRYLKGESSIFLGEKEISLYGYLHRYPYVSGENKYLHMVRMIRIS